MYEKANETFSNLRSNLTFKFLFEYKIQISWSNMVKLTQNNFKMTIFTEIKMSVSDQNRQVKAILLFGKQ